VLNGTPTIYYFADPPPTGPSGGALIMDAIFGAGTSNDLHGITKLFSPALNVSTYKTIELDIKNQAGWDQYNKVQAIQLNLQVPGTGGPTYQRGTCPDIVLDATLTGSTWTHYSAALADWAAYDLTSVTAFGIDVLDFNCVTSGGTEMYPTYANIAFCSAPAWAPSFSVASTTIVCSQHRNPPAREVVRQNQKWFVPQQGFVTVVRARTRNHYAPVELFLVDVRGCLFQSRVERASGGDPSDCVVSGNLGIAFQRYDGNWFDRVGYLLVGLHP
jgi:hypothetical protein